MTEENNKDTEGQTPSKEDIKNSEMILVIPKVIVDSYLNKSNWEKVNGPVLTPIVARLVLSCMSYMAQRGSVEKDTRVLQPIPYGCIMDKDDKVLVYRRTSHGGEKRLENMYSIGFGGHVNITDVRLYLMKMNITKEGLISPDIDMLLNGPLAECLRRELKEELGIEECFAGEEVNVDEALYDIDEEVSSVHVGIPYIIRLEDTSKIKQNENTIDELQWVAVSALATPEWQAKLEGWSQTMANRINHYKNYRKQSGDSAKKE